MTGEASETIRRTDPQFGPRARNRLDETSNRSIEGARAALESVYYALNNREAAVLREDWTDHPLAQLNNPLGGILRAGGRSRSSTSGSSARRESRSPSVT